MSKYFRDEIDFLRAAPSYTRVLAMFALAEHGDLTRKRIAELLGISHVHACGLISSTRATHRSLSSLGLVESTGEKSMLALTDKGREMLDWLTAGNPRWRQGETKILAQCLRNHHATCKKVYNEMLKYGRHRPLNPRTVSKALSQVKTP